MPQLFFCRIWYCVSSRSLAPDPLLRRFVELELDLFLACGFCLPFGRDLSSARELCWSLPASRFGFSLPLLSSLLALGFRCVFFLGSWLLVPLWLPLTALLGLLLLLSVGLPCWVGFSFQQGVI